VLCSSFGSLLGVPKSDSFRHFFRETVAHLFRTPYRDSPRAGRSGDRISVEAGLSAPVQTGPGAHPVSYTMGTGSFQGVKQPGRGVDHRPLLSWIFMDCSRVNFTFTV
jgi:hypothetical protein